MSDEDKLREALEELICFVRTIDAEMCDRFSEKIDDAINAALQVLRDTGGGAGVEVG